MPLTGQLQGRARRIPEGSGVDIVTLVSDAIRERYLMRYKLVSVSVNERPEGSFETDLLDDGWEHRLALVN